MLTPRKNCLRERKKDQARGRMEKRKEELWGQKKGERHTKLHVWKSNWPLQKKTELLYYRKLAFRQLSFQQRKGARKERRNRWAYRPHEFMKPSWHRIEEHGGALDWCKEHTPQMLFLFYDFQYHYFKNKHSQHEHTLQQTVPRLNIHGACHFFTSISQSH